MPRRAKTQEALAESAPVAQLVPEMATVQDAPAQEPPSEPDVFDKAIERQAVQPAAAEPQSGEPARQEWVNKGFRGRQHIALGDGRIIHLSRNDSTQQIAIHFEAEQGVDPRPAQEDRDFLKQNGFYWRGKEMRWVRDFFTPEERERYKAMAEVNPQQTRLERGEIRARVDRQAEETFVQLANTILVRNGKEPKEYAFSQDRGRAV